MGLPGKILFWWAHSDPGPTGSIPPSRGICVDNFEGPSKQKLLLRVGLPGKIIFVGAQPNMGPAGSTSPKGVICI